MAFLSVSQKIDALRDESVNFLSRICAIPALGPENQGTGEMRKYLMVREMVRSLSPDLEVEVPAPDNRVPEGVRPNLLVKFRGRDHSRTLWILSHVDVVPPGEAGLWDSDPFLPHVSDGRLYGRGVEDNGQALVAAIFAVKAVKETCGLGIDVGLAIVSDEENGSHFGLEYVLDQRPDLFGADDLIVVPDAGNEQGDHIEIAEKHMLQVKFTVRGKQVHASRPDMGANSLRAAANLIVELDKTLSDRFSIEDPFYRPATSTFEPTKKEANVPNINTVPGEDVFYFDCRVLPEIPLEDVTKVMESVAAQIDRRFGVESRVEVVIKFAAPEPTPADSPVVMALAQAILEVYGVQARPHGIGGQTVAAFFRKKGLRAAVWEKILNTAHEPNERISIDNLVGDTKVFARMMM
ncbi:MAG: M20 family metallo-hydrolase [Thermodesulfobacteriota bacterium]